MKSRQIKKANWGKHRLLFLYLICVDIWRLRLNRLSSNGQYHTFGGIVKSNQLLKKINKLFYNYDSCRKGQYLTPVALLETISCSTTKSHSCSNRMVTSHSDIEKSEEIVEDEDESAIELLQDRKTEVRPKDDFEWVNFIIRLNHSSV